MKKIFISLIIILTCWSAIAQNQRKVDSLKTLIAAIKDDSAKVEMYLLLGDQFEHTIPDTALKYYENAEVLAEEREVELGLAKSLNYIGIVYKDRDKYDLALGYQQRSLEIKERLGAKMPIVLSLNNIGEIFREQGRYDTALTYYNRALNIAKEEESVTGITLLLGNLGLIWESQGNFSKALRYYHEALEINLNLAEELEDNLTLENREAIILNNTRKISYAYANIGNVYYYMHDYSTSIEFWKKSLAIKRKLGDKLKIANMLNNLGSVYDEMGNPEDALTHINQALTLFEEIDSKKGQAVCFTNLGGIFLKQGSFNLAEEYFLKSIKMKEEINDRLGLTKGLQGLAAYYMEVGQFQNAIDVLDRGVALAQEITDIFAEHEHLSLLADAHAELGNYKLALANFKSYSALKDSLFNEDKSKEIGKLEAKHEFQTEEKRKQLEAQALKETRESNERRRNNLQYSIIIIVIVLLALGLVSLGRIQISHRMAEGLIFFTFLLFFEFLLVLLDPYIERLSSGAPALKLAFNAILAGMIFPLHSFFEERIKSKLA